MKSLSAQKNVCDFFPFEVSVLMGFGHEAPGKNINFKGQNRAKVPVLLQESEID